jgi:hypothetical protein
MLVRWFWHALTALCISCEPRCQGLHNPNSEVGPRVSRVGQSVGGREQLWRARRKVARQSEGGKAPTVR